MRSLTNNEIRSLCIGALNISEREDGTLRFEKYTVSQMNGFGVWNENSPVLCTTGIRLDFHTNSKKFAFAAASVGKYELYVDSQLRAQYEIGPADKGGEYGIDERIEFSLCDALGNEKNEYRITLYLPSHSIGRIRYVELDDGAFARRHVFECKTKLLMIGDSITQGWNSSYDSFSYANRVSRFFDAESVIQGRGGSCYKEETIEKLVGFEPDLIIVAYGTNDFHYYKTLDEMRLHVSAYLDRLREAYPDKDVIVISPIWRENQQKPMGSFEECRAVITEEVEKRGLVCVDGLELVPPIAELFTDGLHPNDLGFSMYSENLIKIMNKYIKE